MEYMIYGENKQPAGNSDNFYNDPVSVSVPSCSSPYDAATILDPILLAKF